METFKTIFGGVGVLVIIFSLGVIFGLGFKLAYNFIENKTKKVCDLCFRDIKKVNEQYKKLNK